MRKSVIYIVYLVFLCCCMYNVAHSQLSSVTLNEKMQATANEYKKLIDKYTKDSNFPDAANYCTKLAYLYWEQGSSKEAVNYFLQAIDLNKKYGNRNALRTIYSNIGNIYSDVEDYNNAVSYYLLSIEINTKMNKKRDVGEEMVNLALALNGLRKYNEAIKNLDKAASIAQELNDIKFLKKCYAMLAENYEALGNTKKSFEYYQLYQSLQKHIQKEELSQMEQTKQEALAISKVREQQLKTTVDTLRKVEKISNERQMEIKLWKKENELKELTLREQEAKIREEKARNRFFIGLAVFLIVFAIIIYYGYRQKKLSNKLLEKQNKEILEQQDIIKKKNQDITMSIAYAERIQSALFPTIDEFKNYIPESFILFKPRDIVSGDFYWFSGTKLGSFLKSVNKSKIIEMPKIDPKKDTDKIIVSAVDCTGHGVPGAFMSMIGYNLLHETISRGIIEPDRILNLLNQAIRIQLKQEETDNRDGMDMSICVIDKKKNILEFAGAKNPLVYVKGGKLHLIRGDYMAIGGFDREFEQKIFSKHTVKIDKPTTFYIFSDGYQDQIGGDKGRKFMTKRFRELLFKLSNLSMEEQKEELEKRLQAWIGDDLMQVDDILIIAFKLYPN